MSRKALMLAVPVVLLAALGGLAFTPVALASATPAGPAVLLRSSDNVNNQVGASAVDDNYAVWSEIDWSLGPDQGIRVDDLSTGNQRWSPGPSAGSMGSPAVSGDTAVWSQEDVQAGGYDIYSCDLASGDAPTTIATGLSNMPSWPSMEIWSVSPSPPASCLGYNLATQKSFSIDSGLPNGSALDDVAVSGTESSGAKRSPAVGMSVATTCQRYQTSSMSALPQEPDKPSD